MSAPLITIELKDEHDVVLARRRARELAASAGLGEQDQVRVATSVSEVARHAVQSGRDAKARFRVDGGPPAALVIEVEDVGSGAPDLRRLMDRFEIRAGAGGTCVAMAKLLPGGMPRPGDLAADLAVARRADPLEEIRAADDDLVRALIALGERDEALARMSRELEETNRGVVALYAELDERAESLRRASELKSRFLSNMTHEFRTPVNSILSLSQMLLEQMDGPLNPEQTRQVGYVRKAAQSLSELVNDLLDLAKVEAGKASLRLTEVSVGEVLSGVRGLLRAIASNPAVTLTVEEPPELIVRTDEGKLSQILRNLVSNALKFTERGEVRVSVVRPAPDRVAFVVSDTGIGINPDDMSRIFEEFHQVDTPMNRRLRGTGLGLPLSRKLAELLGGRLEVKSAVGAGSTFTLELPLDLQTEAVDAAVAAGEPDPARVPVLILDGDPEHVRACMAALPLARFQVLTARSIAEARATLERVKPALVVLDVLLPGESAWHFVRELREALPGARIVVATRVQNEEKALSQGADAFFLKPVDPEALRALAEAPSERPAAPVALVIDDDEIARYLVRGLLGGLGLRVVEAAGGRAGLDELRTLTPAVVVLDLLMPEVSGFDVLDEMRAGEATRDIPVIVHSSLALSPEVQERLAGKVTALLPKHSASREEATGRLREALVAAGVRLSG